MNTAGTWTCPTSSLTPTGAAPRGHLQFFQPSSTAAAPGSESTWQIPVCDQPDGTQGALTLQRTAQKGCLTAQAMCCGGKTPQCMVEKNDHRKSLVQQVQVPCGAQVTTSYTGRCKSGATEDAADATTSASDRVETIRGSGVPYTLTCDTSTASTCPYAFQVALAPGYECSDAGDIVVSATKEVACAPSASGPDGSSSTGTGAGGITHRQVVIGMGIAALLVVGMMYAVLIRPARSTLTVDEIVARAGVKAHLVAPEPAK